MKVAAVFYDVTGMTDEEIGGLLLEASVQGESSEHHPAAKGVTSEVYETGGVIRPRLNESQAAALNAAASHLLAEDRDAPRPEFWLDVAGIEPDDLRSAEQELTRATLAARPS